MGRGHRSGTYEITALVAVNEDQLTITYRHAGAATAQAIGLAVTPCTAARQMLRAMATSFKISGSADRYSGWESQMTLQNGRYGATHMLHELEALGIDDFGDERLTIAVLQNLYAMMPPNMQRTANWLLARTVEANHQNGVAIATALRATRFTVHETSPFVYDEEVAAAIEKAARSLLLDAINRQRGMLEAIGCDTSGRDWLTIPAEDVIARVREQFPEQTADDAWPPHPGAPHAEKVAWVLTHPQYFTVEARRQTRQLRRYHRFEEIGLAVYPDGPALLAGLITHCLGENAGYNVSTLLETSATSLKHIGNDVAMEYNTKARSHSEDWRPTRTKSFFTPGGTIQAMTGLTRFIRHHRIRLLDDAGEGQSPLRDRLYVEHVADVSNVKVFGATRRVAAWRRGRWAQHWPKDLEARDPLPEVPLNFPALRLFAMQRAMRQGLRSDVHGHGQRTKVHYLQNVLPAHVLAEHVVMAQDDIHTDAIAPVRPASDHAAGNPADRLAAVPEDARMDVEVGVCVSGGNLPDGSGSPCTLGITACFTCPNGYRTIDHLPGLLAAVEFARIVETNDPVEWAGEASRLGFYAQKSLDQFPPLLVQKIHNETDLTGHILTVAALYGQLRHTAKRTGS